MPVFPPPGACDCHVHVIGPKSRFPLARERSYTPMDALVPDLAAMLARLRLDRVVLVQPSIYGADNACMLDAIAQLGARARGVAVADANTPGSELDRLHGAGVRGLRVNVVSSGSDAIADVRGRLESAATLCARNGWHVQAFLSAASIEPLARVIAELPAPVVIDHFGLLAAGSDEAAALPLMRLLGTGRVWVKLSALYRLAGDPFDPALAPLARRLAIANPQRVVWGSDWPHTPAHGREHVAGDEETPYRNLDTSALLALARTWFDEDGVWQLLVDNPAELYGFA